jgi:hypothetical protein
MTAANTILRAPRRADNSRANRVPINPPAMPPATNNPASPHEINPDQAYARI